MRHPRGDPAQLIATRAENLAPGRVAAAGSGGDNPNVVDLAALRPIRAQLLDDGTGRINPVRQPLADLLLDTPNWKPR